MRKMSVLGNKKETNGKEKTKKLHIKKTFCRHNKTVIKLFLVVFSLFLVVLPIIVKMSFICKL